MKKRYRKPKVKLNALPSRRKLAAELAEKKQVIALRTEVLAAERQNRSEILAYANDLRRECDRLRREVDNLIGDEWKMYCVVGAKKWEEPIPVLDVQGGSVHVAVRIDWRPWQKHSRGREADLALLGEVKRKLLQMAGEKLDVELRMGGG